MIYGDYIFKFAGWLLLILCSAFLMDPAVLCHAQQVQAMRSVDVLSIDESGSPLRFPSGVSYDRDGDELYVTSPQQNKLVILTADYFPYLSIGSGRGLNSISKTYVKNGLLYVCVGASSEESRPHIAVYDMAFMPVQKIYFPDFARFYPLDLVVSDSGTLYVIGMNGTGVMVLDAEGTFQHWIEPQDEVLGLKEKAPILAIEMGIDGQIYLLSEAMGRIYVYDRSERFLFKFGEKGGEPGKLSRPRGIAVDDHRRQIYVIDYQRHSMSVYAKNGKYLFEVGGLGGGRGWFYYPSDVVVDGRGRVIVADTFNHRLQVFEFVSNKGFGNQEESIRQLAFVGDTLGEELIVEPEKPINRVHIRPLKDEWLTEDQGDFVLVAMITKSQADAELMSLQLVRTGYAATLREIHRQKSGRWFQVLVGPFVDPLEAYGVMKSLHREEHLPAMLKTRSTAIYLELPDDQSGEAVK